MEVQAAAKDQDLSLASLPGSNSNGSTIES
jgi:hypothetical protein